MKPIEFREATAIFGKDQPQYLPLTVHVTKDGTVISAWKLTWRERAKVAFTGVFWFSQMTFGRPLQPQLPAVDRPFMVDSES